MKVLQIILHNNMIIKALVAEETSLPQKTLGNDPFWTVTGDNVTSLVLTDYRLIFTYLLIPIFFWKHWNRSILTNTWPAAVRTASTSLLSEAKTLKSGYSTSYQLKRKFNESLMVNHYLLTIRCSTMMKLWPRSRRQRQSPIWRQCRWSKSLAGQ